MRKDYLVFGAPYIGEEEIAEVVATLRSGWIGTGPKTAQFEREFAEYVGAKYAVAVASCTAALHLSILALNLKPGDEVITTPMTFCATANAILHSRAVPVFADIDPVTQNIDPKDVERKITTKTRAILPVHLYGRSCDMDALLALCEKHRLRFIGDCAHAIETSWHGQRVGGSGDINCFSFYPTKNVVTIEGGMVTTDDEEVAATVKRLALHGMTKDAWKRFGDDGYKHYQVVHPGYKYNMTDIQASMGLHQLRRVDSLHARRQAIWNRYQEAFKNLPVERPREEEKGTLHAFHLYTLLVDKNRCGIDRDTFLNRLHKLNIGAGVHYVAVHLQPYYMETFGMTRGMFPHAEFVSDRTVSLPLSARLTDQDVGDVIEAVRSALDA
ncbi:MAG: DegT/DnrJ/EryC1/StrS family aminotransferase [Planctomycetota bacterium]